LLVVGALVDDGLTLAVTFIDRPGPRVEESCTQTVEHDVSKVATIDAHGSETTTISVSRTRGLELAGTGVVAVAVADFDSFDAPVNLWHRVLRRAARVNMTLLVQ
jgi:hypothetical protein